MQVPPSHGTLSLQSIEFHSADTATLGAALRTCPDLEELSVY